MIYPTRRAVVLMALGALLALAVAAWSSGRWAMALVWPLVIVLLVGLDALKSRGPLAVALELPGSAYVGETRDATVDLRLGARADVAQLALAHSPVVEPLGSDRSEVGLAAGAASVRLPLAMLRRGTARIERLWLRWQGPLGLVWRQHEQAVDQPFPILPDLRPTQRLGATLFERYAVDGTMRQFTRGEGSDFDALVEFRPGMDRRAIDWKSSARATRLLARHYHGEKNNQIVFALDCGRQMSEPVAGLPRLDRMIAGILLTAWLALRLGDRVAINAFDSRPRVASGLVSGAGAFAEVQRLTASIDYGVDETNYTFALTDLNARLSRRSLVILFTEFTDRVSARFLLATVRLLIRTHLLLVVVLRDEELEAFVEARPDSADDVTRAITAAELIRDRQEVIAELRRLGVEVLEADHERVAPAIAEAYLEIKRRDRL
ncbi:DUF58 domain-containing protein [Sphingomonas ginkgonis]|uniref:DUF58 domain-containing protein n=1 Tax=Sphingomonas ginkgonis TaxID=2315330 RepID=A0A3R9X7K2_9SPHN|nr:DUF58 domain-containing protein [Sphingomonas ginkgonis]RST30620.1 DUF58 domain-containing protein [Sphingomonas ginkgonis]